MKVAPPSSSFQPYLLPSFPTHYTNPSPNPSPPSSTLPPSPLSRPTYSPNPIPSPLAKQRVAATLKYYTQTLEPYLADATAYLLLTRPSSACVGLQTYFMGLKSDPSYLSKVTVKGSGSRSREEDGARRKVLENIGSLLTLAAAEATRRKVEGRDDIIDVLLECCKDMDKNE